MMGTMAMRFVCLALLLAATAFAQPVVYPGGVVNAASYAVSGLPGNGIAQGSRFALCGTGLGPAFPVNSSYPLKTNLAGTSIRLNVSGQSLDALVIYTSATLVVGLLPSQTPLGSASLVAAYNGAFSAPVQFTVSRNAFGAYTRNNTGSGPGVLQNFNSQTDTPPNSMTQSAHPGQAMILWGTGLGAVNSSDAQPPAQVN